MLHRLLHFVHCYIVKINDIIASEFHKLEKEGL